jgi:hypothetical protein
MPLSEQIIKKKAHHQANGLNPPTNNQYTTEEKLVANRLDYTADDDPTLVVSRQRRESKATLVEVAGGNSLSATWHTGESYIDCKNSYLKFSVKVTKVITTPLSWEFADDGSVCNLIESIVVTSKVGKEMMRLHRFDLFRYLMDAYGEDPDFKTNEGTQMGYGSTGLAANEYHHFCIPLNKLEGVFKPDKGLLMPPFVAVGLQVTINFTRNLNKAIKSSAADTGLTYSIKDLSFVLDCQDLNEQTDRNLSKVSDQNGLEYSYSTYHHQPTPGTGNSINLTMNKSVARSTSAMISFTENAAVLANEDGGMVSKYEGTTDDDLQFYMALGSIYYPARPITTPVEAFNNAMYSLAPRNRVSVSRSTFKSNYAVLSSTLERIGASELSGLPIGSGRSLLAQIDTMPSMVNKTVHMFMTYKVLARIYLDNILLIF